MIPALKISLLYMAMLAVGAIAMGVPMFGIVGGLLSHGDPTYLIPMFIGTFILLFVVHSPLQKRFEAKLLEYKKEV